MAPASLTLHGAAARGSGRRRRARRFTCMRDGNLGARWRAEGRARLLYKTVAQLRVCAWGFGPSYWGTREAVAAHGVPACEPRAVGPSGGRSAGVEGAHHG